ncbi:MAG: GTPase Era [Solobacterium sp.]|nr:GTPase Era [Solobacterium sp.]
MKCGFVALVGRPNAGKSTLMNALIKDKIAIVSNKPQTTRSEIRGIFNSENSQIIFTDTPGIHKPQHRLGARMNKQATTVLHGVDVVYLVVDGSVPFSSGDAYLLQVIENVKVPVFLILNKMDRVEKEKIIQLLNDWKQRFPFAEYFPISALKQSRFKDLIKTTEKYLPEQEPLYPTDMITDEPENFMLAELIREKVLLATNEEVPHATAVYIENKEFKKNAAYIQAVILVERQGQKGIIIGKNGTMLKRIATLAREDMEQILGRKVYLEIFVRVEEEWRNKDKKITEYGYGFIDE